MPTVLMAVGDKALITQEDNEEIILDVIRLSVGFQLQTMPRVKFKAQQASCGLDNLVQFSAEQASQRNIKSVHIQLF